MFDVDAYFKIDYLSFYHFEVSGNFEKVKSCRDISNIFIIILFLKRPKHFNLTTVKILLKKQNIAPWTLGFPNPKCRDSKKDGNIVGVLTWITWS